MHMIYGTMGGTPGFYTNQQQLTEDNDGVFVSTYAKGVIDLTHILSRALGKQLSQYATYRVSYIQMQLRNVDDAIDNDSAAFFGGNIRWYVPTKHRINALQLARTYIRHAHEGTVSADPFAEFGTDKKYKGVRFNWDADDQISDATPDETAGMTGDDFSMSQVFNAYNDMISGTPGGEGYNTSGEGQALWERRLADPITNGLQWVTGLRNRGITNNSLDDFEMFSPQSQPWTWTAPAGQTVPVLGGLLLVNLTHGNTDAPGVVEDEYELLVNIGIEGWEEF